MKRVCKLFPKKGYLNLLVILLLGSCISQRKLEYVQNPIEKKAFKVSKFNDHNAYKPPEMHIIKPNDHLLINVSSFDDLSFNYFGAQESGRSFQASNELALNAMSYSVDINGLIYFPVIGKTKVSGLTLEETRDKLSEALTPYFDQPEVSVKFAFKKVTVLGEVNRPGYYTYTKDQITVFEALAMAGDLTLHGNRKRITLIRNEKNNATKYEIDITKDTDVFNYNYYLKPGDILYVTPRRSVIWRDVSIPITLFFSTVTTTLLVFNAMNQP